MRRRRVDGKDGGEGVVPVATMPVRTERNANASKVVSKYAMPGSPATDGRVHGRMSTTTRGRRGE